MKMNACAMQKIFCTEHVLQGRERRNRSKNGESVPSDSGWMPPMMVAMPCETMVASTLMRRRWPPIAHAKLPRGASPARHRRCSAERSAAELAREDFVDRLRTCFAARRLHHLTDEPTDRFRIGPGLCDLVRIGGDDLVDHLLDGAQVGDLLHAARVDDGAGIAAFGPEDFE